MLESGILEKGSLDAATLEDVCGDEVAGTFVLKKGFIVVHLKGFVGVSVAFFLGFVGFVSGGVSVVVDTVVGGLSVGFLLDGYLVDSKLLAVTFNVWVLWNVKWDDAVLCTANVVRCAVVFSTGRDVIQLLVLLPAAFSEVTPGPTVFPSTPGSSLVGLVIRPLLVLVAPDVVFGGIQEAVVIGFFVITATVNGVVVKVGVFVVTKGRSWYEVMLTLTGW